jgi:hypothetical protein
VSTESQTPPELTAAQAAYLDDLVEDVFASFHEQAYASASEQIGISDEERNEMLEIDGEELARLTKYHMRQSLAYEVAEISDDEAAQRHSELKTA